MEPSRRAGIIAVVYSGCFAGAWMLSIGSHASPLEYTVSNVASSRTGRWLGWSTLRGEIVIQDQESRTAARKIDSMPGPLNDLQFSPDEHSLAVAGRSLVIYALESSSAPRLIRDDGRNYGTVRHSGDGETLLVVTGGGVIETIDARSRETRLHVCCSSVYGEVAFTPDGQGIVNAGRWPRVWDARSGRLLATLTANQQSDPQFRWRIHYVRNGTGFD